MKLCACDGATSSENSRLATLYIYIHDINILLYVCARAMLKTDGSLLCMYIHDINILLYVCVYMHICMYVNIIDIDTDTDLDLDIVKIYTHTHT
jgi:hypothetical protein